MIKFGTDGWRGIISEDYTFNNVRLVAEALARYIKDRKEDQRGLVVGYDARFLSRQYAESCAAVLANSNIKVWLSDSILTSPALTWQVKDHQAAGGIMITASHNPPEYNGLKFKAAYGGSASPEIVADIEKYIYSLESSGQSFPKVNNSNQYDYFTPQQDYLKHVKAILDKDVLRQLKDTVIFDCMHGAAQGYTAELAKTYELKLLEIRNEYNPSFGGVNPEPIEKNLQVLRNSVMQKKAVVGLATDGDGDRIGAIDQDGRFINSHQIMALLLKYLVEKRGWSGSVAKTITVSELIRRVANKYGLEVYETPVGFKYIANLMLKKDILIGGEESGGIGIKNYIPERDGIMLGFLLIELVAAYGKTLGIMLDEMSEELGSLYYDRVDLQLAEEQKEQLLQALINSPPKILGDKKVININSTDGCKLFFTDGWAMFRASGTEPIVRIYAEADSKAKLIDILTKAVQYAKQA